MAKPTLTQVPPDSLIASYVPGADFHDAWCVETPDVRRSALGLFIKSAVAAPAWVETCMALRNRLAALIGLKDLGDLSAIDIARGESSYQPGDRVGIFTLVRNTYNEVLLGDSDRHLKVTLSVHRRELDAGRVLVTVTTVVKVRNALGHLYMIPVKPMHRRIAPAVLAALG